MIISSFTADRARSLFRQVRTLRCLFAVACLALGARSAATPPNYTTFGREQKPDFEPRSEDLLRIWMVYVNQGDGFVLQLPPKFKYDSSGTSTQRIDILIDGGSNPASDSYRIAN